MEDGGLGIRNGSYTVLFDIGFVSSLRFSFLWLVVEFAQ
jgi:hypothetical protein